MLLNRTLKNRRIIIFGGAGSIGNELVRQLSKENKVFIFDQNETGAFDLTEELRIKGHEVSCRIGDIRDYKAVDDVFSDFKPQIVFQAAALKHVTPNEKYPIEAINTNIIGTYNILHCAKRYEVKKLVYISTDKVVNANSVMGITKKVGEVMTKNQGYIAVRFGNVMGSRGSVIPIWQDQITRGEPLTITDPRMERYMMTIPEACSLVIEACQKGEPGEIWVMDMGEKINILDLAKQIIGNRKIGIKTIGERPGETMSERLMTLEEERSAIKRGKFYVIK